MKRHIHRLAPSLPTYIRGLGRAPTLCSRPLTATAHFEHNPWARVILRFSLLRTLAATSFLHQRRLLYTKARVLALSLEWSSNAAGGSGRAERPRKRRAVVTVRSPVRTRARVRRNKHVQAQKQAKARGRGKKRGKGRGKGKRKDEEEEEEEEEEGGESSQNFAGEAVAVAKEKERSGDGGVLGCLIVCDINDPRIRHALEIVHNPRYATLV